MAEKEPATVEVEYLGDYDVREIDKKSFEGIEIDHPKVVWDRRGSGKATMTKAAGEALVEKYGKEFKLA